MKPWMTFAFSARTFDGTDAFRRPVSAHLVCGGCLEVGYFLVGRRSLRREARLRGPHGLRYFFTPRTRAAFFGRGG
jgi:hypothetical protein